MIGFGTDLLWVGLIQALGGTRTSVMFDTSYLFDVLSAPRFAVPFLVSIGIAIGVYYWTGQ